MEAAVWYWIAFAAVHSLWVVPVGIMAAVFGEECLRVWRGK